MVSPTIPTEHVYCVQAGKKHHELFTTIYAGENYCGRCGLANPFSSQRRGRSRTPAIPGPDDEVVELEDTPPRPVSPASQLMRDRTKKKASFSGIGHAQLLPNTISALSGANSRGRIPSSNHPPFSAVASAASQAIHNAKTTTRKPMRQRTGYQWVHISLLLVSLETRDFNGLVVEIPETVLPLKDTVIKFNSADLLTWPAFTETLFDHLRPLPSTIDPANKELWSLSYASAFSGKKIVTVPNTNKYTTPSSMLASGHFSNNQAGQLKVLVVLTSTQVVDKQEPITPLRPDEFSTPTREKRKRKIKEENESPSGWQNKRVKEEKRTKDGFAVEKDEIKQEIHVKIQDDFADSLPALSCDESNLEGLDGVDESLSDLIFGGTQDMTEGDEETGGEVGDGADTKFASEFVRSQANEDRSRC